MSQLPPENQRLNEAYMYLKGQSLVVDRRDMASKMPISYSHLSTMFSGGRGVTDKFAGILETKFGISKAWLKMGIGEMLSGKRLGNKDRFIDDNIIYHISPEKMGLLLRGVDEHSKVSCWCMPGLQGTFFSFSIDTNDLGPEISRGSILITREIKEKDWLVNGRKYISITKGVMSVIKYNDKEKNKKTEKLFAIITHVPKALV